MDERSAQRIEAGVDAVAAGVLGCAVSFALARLGSPALGAAVGVPVSLLSFRALRRVEPRPRAFALASFGPLELPKKPGELLLTEVLDVGEALEQVEQALVLEDALPAIAPDSRVVRLFDRAAMPSAAELRSRVDRRLRDARRQGPADDSDALYAALDELRRSLAP